VFTGAGCFTRHLRSRLRFTFRKTDGDTVHYSFVQKGKILGTYFDCSSSPKTASVPTDKVAKTVKVIDAALALKWLPVTDVQVLLGLIAYCSKILVCSKHHL